MTLFKNRYRVESRRLKGWDYKTPAAYFVTICAGGMKELFGEVRNGIVLRNDIGESAHQMWLQIPHHHEGVTLDEFIVMPNHIHGIIVLCDHPVSDVACNVATKNHTKNMSEISPKKGSLGSIVRSYKSAVTNWCHLYGHRDSIWQSKFHDHIVRDDNDLDRIRDYIRNNPKRWEENRIHHLELASWLD